MTQASDALASILPVVPVLACASQRGRVTRVVVLLLALLASGCVAPAPPTDNGQNVSSPPPGLSSFSVTAVRGDEQLSVRWRYANNGAFTKVLHLDLYRIVNGAPYTLASTIVGHTIEPDSYTIPVIAGTWAVRATPENPAGFGPGVTSAPVTIASTCSSATICTRVSNPSSATTVRLAGQGFLMGMTNGAGDVLNRAKVEALDPRQWRFSGATSNAAATNLRVSRMQILSNLWNSATVAGNGGYARTPWSDWSAWRSFVQLTVRQAERQGWAPDYWDVWNEPNGTCCPRFSPADQATVSVDRWLQTYVVAWQAIKSVDRAAKVVGPSLSALQWAPGAPAEFDLDTFLRYSAARGVRWDAVSWHENTTAPSPGDILPSITNVDRHIAMAKAVMAHHPGTVVNNAILVNEYGPRDTHTLAGWAVGFFRAFEDNGVRQANRACWSEVECTTQLDGLLTPSGEATALWWAHKRYADLAGGTRMTVASTASWQVDGLATRNDPTQTVRVLLGRHWSCGAPVNTWCGYDAHIGPASLTVTIDWPYGTTPATVTTSRLPAGTSAIPTLPVLSSVVATPNAGTLTVSVPDLNDGEAISIVATRA